MIPLSIPFDQSSLCSGILQVTVEIHANFEKRFHASWKSSRPRLFLDGARVESWLCVVHRSLSTAGRVLRAVNPDSAHAVVVLNADREAEVVVTALEFDNAGHKHLIYGTYAGFGLKNYQVVTSRYIELRVMVRKLIAEQV